MYVSTTAIAHTPEEMENLINTFIDEKNLKYILKSKLMTDEDVNSAFFELESIYEMHRENKELENTRFFSKEDIYKFFYNWKFICKREENMSR